MEGVKGRLSWDEKAGQETHRASRSSHVPLVLARPGRLWRGVSAVSRRPRSDIAARTRARRQMARGAYSGLQLLRSLFGRLLLLLNEPDLVVDGVQLFLDHQRQRLGVGLPGRTEQSTGIGVIPGHRIQGERRPSHARHGEHHGRGASVRNGRQPIRLGGRDS